jgi:hypothetical protein
MKVTINIMKNILFLSIVSLLFFSCSKQNPPAVLEFEPLFGPEGTLIKVKGSGFNDLLAINFNDGVRADFNPSYGKENALLFRVPEFAPLGDNKILIATEYGETTINFKVTLEAPEIKDFKPKSSQEGQIVTIYGKNFFEPVTVLFADSIAGKIVSLTPDSLKVEVPPNVIKGKIKVKANGGPALTSEVFFTTSEILVNDFDGNGVRADTKKWLFYGSIDQNANNAVQGTLPAPISKNYLKITGKDPGTVWIGGTESYSNDVDVFPAFKIKSKLDDTFVEFDIHNNGIKETFLIIVLDERNGSQNDFSYTLKVDQTGWRKERIPLNRFKDDTGLTLNPQKIKTIKMHLINQGKSSKRLEANIDNIKFIQIN